ncbi:MAG: hypothetical protein J6B07_05755 [Opitutales bacterium]|nr:hypothetical protein [Opitutales bacterium]
MAYQLVYTSYSASLIQGRTGFSTVARCKSMPERLVSEVERISQYDLAHGTVYAHRIIRLSSTSYHILSRTKDCGVDYTNRNNYIAHHLIFSDNEIDSIEANPAEIMLGYNQWIDSFSGEPRYIEELSPKDFSRYGILKLPANTWLEVFGDSACASVLGNSSLIEADVKDSLLLLRLYAEALLLLKHCRQDWNRTFTTYLLPSDNSSDFNWYVDGISSASVDVSVRSRKCNIMPVGRTAEYARTGIATNSEKYNLKVKQNIGRERQFNVVTNSESSNKLIFILSIVGCIIIMVALAYYFVITDESNSGVLIQQSQQTKQPLVSLKALDKQVELPLKKRETLSQVISTAREKISDGAFYEAMQYWNNSEYANSHAKYKQELEDDILSTIKSMLRFAENVSLNSMASETEKAKALKNLMIIEQSEKFISENTRFIMREKILELRRIINKNK